MRLWSPQHVEKSWNYSSVKVSLLSRFHASCVPGIYLCCVCDRKLCALRVRTRILSARVISFAMHLSTTCLIIIFSRNRSATFFCDPVFILFFNLLCLVRSDTREILMHRHGPCPTDPSIDSPFHTITRLGSCCPSSSMHVRTRTTKQKQQQNVKKRRKRTGCLVSTCTCRRSYVGYHIPWGGSMSIPHTRKRAPTPTPLFIVGIDRGALFRWVCASQP